MYLFSIRIVFTAQSTTKPSLVSWKVMTETIRKRTQMQEEHVELHTGSKPSSGALELSNSVLTSVYKIQCVYKDISHMNHEDQGGFGSGYRWGLVPFVPFHILSNEWNSFISHWFVWICSNFTVSLLNPSPIFICQLYII